MKKQTSISVPFGLHKELSFLKDKRGTTIGTVASEMITLVGAIVRKHMSQLTGEKTEDPLEYEQNIMRNLLRHRASVTFRYDDEEGKKSIAVSKAESDLLRQTRAAFNLTNGQFFELIIPIYESVYMTGIGMDDDVTNMFATTEVMSKHKMQDAVTFLDVYNYTVICNHLTAQITDDMDDDERNAILDMTPTNPWAAVKQREDFM